MEVEPLMDEIADDQENKLEEPGELLELIERSLKVVPIPTDNGRNFTVIEDLIILKSIQEVKTVGLFNVRGICAKLNEGLLKQRTYESIRQRYKRRLSNLSNRQIREMCEFVLSNESDGSCEWKDRQLVGIVPFEKAKAKKHNTALRPNFQSYSNKHSASKSELTQAEETKEDSATRLNRTTKTTFEVGQDDEPTIIVKPITREYFTDFDPTKLHELYSQPEPVLTAMYELADACGMRETVVYDQLKACSMDLQSFQQYLNDRHMEPVVMWTPDEDKMLIEMCTSGQSQSLLIKFKGQERVERRIRYLQKQGALKTE